MKKPSYILLFFLFFMMNSIAQNKLKSITVNDGLPASKLTAITQDRIGYLWFATENNGILRYDGDNFTNFTTKNGLISNQINTIISKNDSLLVGTNKGLTIKYKRKFTHLASPEITALLVDKNTVYVGTKQGIYLLKEDYLLPLKIIYAIDLNHINTLKFDGDYFWVGTKTALWRINSLQNPKLIKKINNANYTSIQFIKNKTVAAAYQKGIKLISNGKIIKTVSNSKNINDIDLINNQLWIATQNDGIEVLNSPDFSFNRNITKYNTEGFGNEIQQVFEDKQHNIWVLGDKLYQFPSVENAVQKPTLFIENIKINYLSLDSILVNSYQKTLQLKPQQNNLAFTFKTVDINHPKSIEYRWKLNKEFSPWSKNTTIHFANLTSGNYTFSVQSRNFEKEESTIKKFLFFIDTPLYKKGGFLLLSFLLFSLIILGLILLYINNLKKKNKQKIKALQLKNHLLSLEQKALQLQMNPHFIFNVLNGIKSLGSSGKTKELSSTISKFANLLRGILHSSRQEEITLSEEINILKNYLDLEQQMNQNSFDYSIETQLKNYDAEEILIPPMLVQPFVENSIKHGITKTTKSGKIIISFTVKHNFLQCSIVDNGVGFYHTKNTAQNHTSVAVEVTKERIKNLSKNAHFSIIEIVENDLIKGTKISFQIPLKTDY